MNAEMIIESLGLEPHPEGGHFRETFRDKAHQGRSQSTAIYYLLRRGEHSHWHRIDTVEIWHFYAGDPLALDIVARNCQSKRYILGPDIVSGQSPQVIVPAHAWQQAKSKGDWALVGCTVAPGFEFSTFELAPKDWTPEQGEPS